jgi:hypothetical protein
MVSINYEFDSRQVQSLVGRTFVKYRCDEFFVANDVLEIVGLFIGDDVFSLRANFEMVDYLGEPDDIAYMKFSYDKEQNICSAFKDSVMIDHPVNTKIASIKVFNDHQLLVKDKKVEYDAHVTRAILFYLDDNREILFEKDNWVYSENISISTGQDLEKELSDVNFFCEGWSDFCVEASCTRSVKEYK